MITDFGAILYEKLGSVAQISLDRPHVLNAYNVQMRDGLYQALEAVRDDPEVRAVVLRGQGERAFCAGADLTEFGTAPSQAIARQVRWERDVWGLLLGLEKPVVAALHGYVLGSGVEMALCCDVRIASEDAQFGMPEVSLGLVPAAGGTQTLPRAVGRGRALELLLGGARINAQEALSMGLVDRVVKGEKLLEAAGSLAQELVLRNPEIVAAIKLSVNTGLDMPLIEAMDMERRLAIMALSTKSA